MNEIMGITDVLCQALQQKSLDNVNTIHSVLKKLIKKYLHTIHSVLKKLIKKFRDNLLENVKTT